MIRLQGEIEVPGDKSISHRAIILASLATGASEIIGYLPSEDCQRTITILSNMGVPMVKTLGSPRPTLYIHGVGLYGLRPPSEPLYCGNSGTTMRLMAGVLSGQNMASVLTGDDSLSRRPMERVITPLRQMGAHISSTQGHAPLSIKGLRLSGICYDLPLPSAQVKSALLLAGLTAYGTTTVSEPSSSRDHTERLFKTFGIELNQNEGRLSVTGGTAFNGRILRVPGDISAAAFFLVAGAIVEGSKITIRGVGINPTRTGILDVLPLMGADIQVVQRPSFGNEPVADITVCASDLQGVSLSGEILLRSIDEFPILCIAAAAASGETVIRGGAELRVKESDRIAVMARALQSIGVTVKEFPDGVSILGCRTWLRGDCDTAGDHRVAMAMAIASLKIPGGITLSDTSCIHTSFPGFMDLLSHLQK